VLGGRWGRCLARSEKHSQAPVVNATGNVYVSAGYGVRKGSWGKVSEYTLDTEELPNFQRCASV